MTGREARRLAQLATGIVVDDTHADDLAVRQNREGTDDVIAGTAAGPSTRLAFACASDTNGPIRWLFRYHRLRHCGASTSLAGIA